MGFAFPLWQRYVALLAAGLAAFALSVNANTPASAPVMISAGIDQTRVTPFLPTADQNTGAAVLLVLREAADPRTTDDAIVPFAHWLNARGIASFVLRTPATAADSAIAIADVQRAVRFIRAHAAEFKISPHRVAVLGLAGGAEIAAAAAYATLDANPAATDPVEKFSSHPDLLALIGDAPAPAIVPATMPPTFLAASTRASDGMANLIELWTKLVEAKISVDAHFFSESNASSGLSIGTAAAGAWAESFFHWLRFNGLLTDEARLPIKGVVLLDGRVLPQGYVIFTPVDRVGTGPVIGRVFNSNPATPLGQFSLPAEQGPIAGRYRVEVRQNMNRWLGNSFSSDLVHPSGAATPEQIYFGHHRWLAPSLGDQRSFTKIHPSDSSDAIVEFRPGAENNLAIKIEVFTE